MAVVEISEPEFQAEVLDTKDAPILVDFYATWCPPCKMLSPIIEKLSDEYISKMKMYKVNTDESPGLARRYNITGVPTTIIFKAGNPYKTLIGYHDIETLRKAIDGAL